MSSLFHPLVSIIIPVYNGANYMLEAIESALGQTYDNIEVLIINDGSTDRTEEFALSYGDKLRYFAKENGGVATALNLGIQNMRGEYFSWLSHDDLYMPEKIQRQVEILDALDDKTTILACGFSVVDKNKKKLFNIDPLGSGQFTQQQLNTPLFALFADAIHGCSLLIHKSHFERVGTFDVNLKTTQDYALWFAMMRGQNFVFHEGLYVIGRSHEEQDSKSKIDLHAMECDEMWVRMMELLTRDEMAALSGNVTAFLGWRLKRFIRSPLPYKRAIAYTCKRIILRILSLGVIRDLFKTNVRKIK